MTTRDAPHRRRTNGFRVARGILVGLTVLGALSLCDCNGNRRAAGNPFEAKAFRTPSETSLRLGDFRKKITIVNVWATWCAPCRDEVAELNAVDDALDKKRFALIAFDQGESKATVESFMKSHPMHYVVALDENQEIGSHFGAVGLPTTIIVNPDGTVRRSIDGPIRAQALLTLLEAL